MNPVAPKEKESGSQSARKKTDENDIGEFEFFPSTKGLGSKIKGFDKIKIVSNQNKNKSSSNVNQLDQIFLCEIFKVSILSIFRY